MTGYEAHCVPFSVVLEGSLLYFESDSSDAAFHFSVEDYIANNTSSTEPILMFWRTDKTVMLGNYQIPHAEIDIEYASKEGIKVVRRSSGGGAIFTDLGTILISMIVPETGVQYPLQAAKETLVELVVSALNEIGLPVKPEGRNDIALYGKKVSGIAQYARNGRICSHCSLLHNTDLEMLSRVLKVDEGKIQSKAIRSVRSRVTNLAEHMATPLSTVEFLSLLKRHVFNERDIGEYILPEKAPEGITGIYNEKYGCNEWTYGMSPRFSLKHSKRFTGGNLDVFLDITDGKIISCSIRGDYLGTEPISGLEELLIGSCLQYNNIEGLLQGVELYPYLGSITKEQFLSCLFG